MRTRLLFQEDSYLKEFEATVVQVLENKIILDATAFHPTPYGGIDSDAGVIYAGDKAYKIVRAEILDDQVAHIAEEPASLAPGEKVRGVIDWERRYNMMRLHTAAHILASVMHRDYGALITGGHILPEYSRDDFDIQTEDWKTAFERAIEETNKLISTCAEVKVYWLSREEALRIPGAVKLADKIPPNQDRLRIVEISDIDVQIDGGPHVRNTCEIGKIVLMKLENRGKRKKRVYYTLEELKDLVKL